MKLHTAKMVKNADDAIQITKNNGKHVVWVSTIKLKESTNCKEKQIVVKESGKNIGFERKYVVGFLNENCIEGIDFISSRDKLNILR